MYELLAAENRVFFPCKREKCGYPWSSVAGLRTEASHGLTEQKKKSQVVLLMAEKSTKLALLLFRPRGTVESTQPESMEEQKQRHHVDKVTC